MWGVVQRTRNRIRALAALVAVMFALMATVFVVRARHDLHDADAGLRTSRAHLAVLRSDLREAVVARTDARVSLEQVRELLRADTAARDRLRATNGSEYRLLVAHVASLAAHRAELAASATRAKRLDDCLIGASQALNAAAVGDVVHLAVLLPRAERLCAQVDA
jgi:hypothetical protein